MRVLLAGKHTPLGSMPIGGVQTWITALKTEFERLGHEVAIWEPDLPLSGLFDFGIFGHLKYTRPALNFCKRSALVCHGIIPDERPEAGCDVTAFVSEGVQEHWGMEGPLVRQPIDLAFWGPSDSPRTHLVRYSYRKAPIHGESVARALGLEYRHAHNATHEQARDILQSAACVLATGRGALEAMACGAPTVIYDHREYQGPLLNDRGASLNMENSYSGRGGYVPTEADVIHACRQEMKLGSPRQWVERNHDARKVAEQLLCFAS